MTKTIHNQSTNKSQSEILQLHLNKECVRKFLFLAPGLEPSSFSSASSFLAIKFLAGICISLLDQFFLMSCDHPLTIYLLPRGLYYKTLRITEKEKIKEKFKELFSP